MSQNAPNQSPLAQSDAGTAYRWLVAWSLLLVILWLINKTQIGHVAVYYSLVLILMFLLVTNPRPVANALRPLTGKPSGPAPAVAASNAGPPVAQQGGGPRFVR